MVNDVAYNHVGRTSLDEQVQGQTGLYGDQSWNPANPMAASIGPIQKRIKL